MNKEQLIKMIELLPIEELNGFKIYYYSVKEKESYGYNSNNNKRDEHSISYGLDYDQLTLQKMDRMNDTIRSQQEEIRQLNEKFYNLGGNNER